MLEEGQLNFFSTHQVPFDILWRQCVDCCMLTFFFLFSSVISQGTTIPYNSDKAAGSLSSMGWDAKRGKERGPVWLVVHKV